LENALLEQLEWKIEGLKPYAVTADETLVRQIAQNDIHKGYTIAANGF
jgi:uridine phosphorylase